MNINTLGELCNLYSGGTPSTKEPVYWNGEFPWLSSAESGKGRIYKGTKNITKLGVANSSTRLAHKGTVLIATAGEGKTRGQVSQLMIDSYINQSLICIDTKNANEVINDYLYYYLKNSYNRLRSLSNATGVRGSLSGNLLKKFVINYPSLSEQIKISIILSRIDDKIELNNSLNSQLESLAKTIYDYWFLQFDFPDENGKPYKSSGGEMVWNEQLKWKTPKGWEVMGLGNICDFRNGINYDKVVKGNQEYRIINVRNISSSSLLLNEAELDKIILPSEQADKYLLSSNDIIIARSGTPGTTRLMWKINEPTIFCGFIICLTPHEALHKTYLTYCLKRLEGTSATKTGGSILQNVSQDTLKSLLVLIPDRQILKQFNGVILPILEKIHKNIDENNELIKLRDWLLPMLMNGQVKFKR